MGEFNVNKTTGGLNPTAGMPDTYPAEQVMMSDGTTSVEEAVNDVASGLTGRLLTYENVTITAGNMLWIDNVTVGRDKVYCCYAKNSYVIAYIAEPPENEAKQLWARNFGPADVTTNIYVKEIG